ncbi:hypothetical protein V8C26DRAFT_354620 [Trichoderma gracile]
MAGAQGTQGRARQGWWMRAKPVSRARQGRQANGKLRRGECARGRGIISRGMEAIGLSFCCPPGEGFPPVLYDGALLVFLVSFLVRLCLIFFFSLGWRWTMTHALFLPLVSTSLAMPLEAPLIFSCFSTRLASFLLSSSRLLPCLALLCRPPVSLVPCAPTVGLAVQQFFSLASPSSSSSSSSSSPPFSHPYAHRPVPCPPPSSLPCIVHWRRFAGIAGWGRFINRAVRVDFPSCVCVCVCVCFCNGWVLRPSHGWQKAQRFFFSRGFLSLLLSSRCESKYLQVHH